MTGSERHRASLAAPLGRDKRSALRAAQTAHTDAYGAHSEPAANPYGHVDGQGERESA